MLSKRNLTRAAIATLVLAFCYGVLTLFQLRFDTGDIYPPYSTLRPDPLGAKAFHDSLALLAGINVARNTTALADVPAQKATMVFLGVRDRSGALETLAPELERFARSGARIVIAFLPDWPELEPTEQPKPRPSAPAAKKQEKAAPKPRNFLHEIGIDTAHIVLKSEGLDQKPIFGGLPRDTSLYFKGLVPAWTVRRSLSDRPVIVERPWLGGSLVLVADSWMLSNDALSTRPEAIELAWLIGPHSTVVFDESHLGIEESGSIAGLIRRYRLHGVVAALIVLAILYVWSRSVPFLPPRQAVDSASVIAGRSSAAGLTGLIERTVPPDKLIEVCLREWHASPAGRGGSLREAVRETITSLPPKSDPVVAYKAIHQTIERLLHPWKQASNS